MYAIEDSLTYGKLTWKTHLNHWVYSSPVLGAKGTLYVGGIDFHVYALNPEGDVKWKHLTDWCVLSSPAIGPDGTIYFAGWVRLTGSSPEAKLSREKGRGILGLVALEPSHIR